MRSAEHESRRPGAGRGGQLDLALLIDGLQAEREQRITIDVAYRYFSTPRRKFIVADTPGHVQYTRNMATGASNCDLAVLLVDARSGVLTQTRRHACILSLLGIRKHSARRQQDGSRRFRPGALRGDRRGLCRTSPTPSASICVTSIPLSALKGDNVIAPSAHMRWYRGPTLLGHLETVDATRAGAERPFRFPVQWVNRPHLDFRGYAGTLASGRVTTGEEVVIQPSGKRAHVARIVTADGDLEAAREGEAVTLTFAEEVDVSRGDIIAHAEKAPADRRPGRGAARLVRRGADAARPRLYAEMRLPDHDGDDLKPQIQAQCRQSRSCGRQDARAERGRLLQSEHGQGAGVRPLRRERRDRRVHPDRPFHQRDGRRRA